MKFPGLTKTLDCTKSRKYNHSLKIVEDSFKLKMIKARKCRKTKAVKENFDDLPVRDVVVRGSASLITVVPKKNT